jgi:hypothetical protein
VKRAEREALREDLLARLESGQSNASLVNYVIALVDRAVRRERARIRRLRAVKFYSESKGRTR